MYLKKQSKNAKKTIPSIFWKLVCDKENIINQWQMDGLINKEFLKNHIRAFFLNIPYTKINVKINSKNWWCWHKEVAKQVTMKKSYKEKDLNINFILNCFT